MSVTPQPPTIAAALAQSGTGFDANAADFDILNAALAAAGLTTALADPGATLTLFAPTDDAFVKLAKSFGFTGNSEQGALDAIVATLTSLAPGGDPIPLLTDILEYHVVGTALSTTAIAAATRIDTLSGQALNPFGLSLGDLDPTAADPKIIAARANQQTGNGVVQAIDRVLLPLDAPEAVPSQPALPTLAGLVAATGNGFDANTHDYDILKAALDAAGLTAALDDAADDLTLLAPNDLAFIRLAREFGFTGGDEAGALTAIVEGLTDRSGNGNPVPLLQQILTYHVLDGSFTRSQLNAAGSATTLQGDDLGFSGRRITDAEPDTGTAFVVDGGRDVRASNGAFQGIEGVLLPFDLTRTIADELARAGAGFDTNSDDFDILNAALDAAGLRGALDVPQGDLTLFAPTDAAFLKLAKNFGFTGSGEQAAFTAIVDALTALSPGGDPIPLLTTVLKYHVAEGALTQAEIVASQTIDTLAGATITPFGTSLGDLDPSIADPKLIAGRADLVAENGFIQAIDRVLLPADLPEVSGSLPAPITLADRVAASGNGFDSNRQDFDMLKAALAAAGLTAALDDADANLTLLAPNDAAFVNLAKSFGYTGNSEGAALGKILDTLTTLSGTDDPLPLLGDILRYHVLEGTLSREFLAAEGSAATLLGPTLGFEGTAIIDAEPDSDAAFTGSGNLAVANGAFQAINAVLLPQDLALI